jgi:hypothetical protein
VRLPVSQVPPFAEISAAGALMPCGLFLTLAGVSFNCPGCKKTTGIAPCGFFLISKIKK